MYDTLVYTQLLDKALENSAQKCFIDKERLLSFRGFGGVSHSLTHLLGPRYKLPH